MRFSVFLLLLAPTFTLAETTFTAVGVQGERVYVATKREKPGHGLQSVLSVVRKKEITKLGLPRELQEREIRALIGTEQGLLVVSQWVIEQGDAPWVHLYSGKWKKLGTIDCPEFTEKIQAGGGKLAMECASGVKSLKVPSKGSAEVMIPQLKAQGKSVAVELQGSAYSWDKLQLSSGGEKTVFPATRFQP
jgi:hypothetical protein